LSPTGWFLLLTPYFMNGMGTFVTAKLL
jgi:hypothetical protein